MALLGVDTCICLSSCVVFRAKALNDKFPVYFRRGRSQSCPFCRDSLKRVNSGDLWVFTEKADAIDLSTILREDRKRLFMYIDRLPLVVPDPVYIPYDAHVR